MIQMNRWSWGCYSLKTWFWELHLTNFFKAFSSTDLGEHLLFFCVFIARILTGLDTKCIIKLLEVKKLLKIILSNPKSECLYLHSLDTLSTRVIWFLVLWCVFAWKKVKHTITGNYKGLHFSPQLKLWLILQVIYIVKQYIDLQKWWFHVRYYI